MALYLSQLQKPETQIIHKIFGNRPLLRPALLDFVSDVLKNRFSMAGFRLKRNLRRRRIAKKSCHRYFLRVM